MRRLECKVCFQPYNSGGNRPKLLPCGHSLCKDCLNDIIARNPDRLECPIDRKAHRMVGADLWPDNYDLLEALQAVELPCSQHSQALAVLFCKEQCLTCCEDCRKRHNCPADLSLETTDISFILQQELGNEPKTANWDNRAKLTELQKRKNQPRLASKARNEGELIRFGEILPIREELRDYGWKLTANPRHIEAAVLRVSKELVLTGIGIGRPIDTQPTAVVYIRIYKGEELVHSSSNIALTHLPGSKDQKVPVTPNLPLRAGEDYLLKIKMQGSSLYNGRPRSRVSPLTSENGAVWTLTEAKLQFPEVLSGPSWLGGPLLAFYYSS